MRALLALHCTACSATSPLVHDRCMVALATASPQSFMCSCQSLWKPFGREKLCCSMLWTTPLKKRVSCSLCTAFQIWTRLTSIHLPAYALLSQLNIVRLTCKRLQLHCKAPAADAWLLDDLCYNICAESCEASAVRFRA